MEQVILIVAFGALALVALSQCAHHSARCRKPLDVALVKRTTSDGSHKWTQTVLGAEGSEDPEQGADREPRPN